MVTKGKTYQRPNPYITGQNGLFMLFSLSSWACSKVALHGIRIAEAGVRFSPGPHREFYP